MKIPDVLKVNKKDLELGTTNSLGYIKSIVEPRKKRDIISHFKFEEDELLGIINNLKPIMITGLDLINEIRKPVHVRYETRDQEVINEIETINYIRQTLDKYLNSIKLYYIFTGRKDVVIIWKNKKYRKRALLLRLLYYQEDHDEETQGEFEKEINIFRESIDTSSRLKDFFFHYVTGTLLGYRPSSIRGYYLSGPILGTLYKMFGYDTDEKRNNFRRKMDKKIVKEQYALAREELMKTEEYQIFIKDYPRFKRKCNEWIEYMLNDSEMFKRYYALLEDQIHTL